MTVDGPRILPLTDADLTEDARQLLAVQLEGHSASGAQDFFRTLVRHPGLYRRFAPFAGKLLVAGKLPARDRELAILRCAWLCRAGFEWGEHVRIARSAGITSAEIERIRQGSADRGWPADEAALLRAVEELHATARLTDATWAELARNYDERQLIELPFLIGAYQMIAYVQNALRVALPEGSAGLESR